MFFKRKYGIKDLLDLMKTADARGYYGMSKDEISIMADGVKIELEGTIIEPVWECFEGGCIVKINDETVYGEDSRNTAPYHNEKYTYGKYRTREETAQGIMGILKDKNCILDNGKEKIKCVFIENKELETNNDNEIISEDDMEM